MPLQMDSAANMEEPASQQQPGAAKCCMDCSISNPGRTRWYVKWEGDVKMGVLCHRCKYPLKYKKKPKHV